MITTIIKVIKLLNSETSPSQIALGIMFGVMIALSPLLALHNLLLVCLVCLLRVNISACALSYGVTALVAYLIQPWITLVGEYLLTTDALFTLWRDLYHYDMARLTRFNQTNILGGIVFSLLLALPVFLFSRWLIIHYRQKILSWVLRTRLIKALKASSWFQRLQTIYNTVGG